MNTTSIRIRAISRPAVEQPIPEGVDLESRQDSKHARLGRSTQLAGMACEEPGVNGVLDIEFPTNEEDAVMAAQRLPRNHVPDTNRHRDARDHIRLPLASDQAGLARKIRALRSARDHWRGRVRHRHEGL